MKRKITLLIGVTIAIMSLTACSFNVSIGTDDESKGKGGKDIEIQVPEKDDRPTVETVEPTDETVEPTDEVIESTVEVVEPTDEAIDVPEVSEPTANTPVVLPNTNETIAAPSGNVSANWYDMEFIMNGVKYCIPFSYSELKADGFVFDITDYGYENGYILNHGDKISSTITVASEEYGSDYTDFTPSIGFINNSTEAKDIYDCEVWGINMSIMYGSRIIDNYPSIELSQGLTWGSSEAEVLAVFGDYENTYRSDDLGYTTYDFLYRDEVNKSDIRASVTIKDDFGLCEFEIKYF